MNNATKEIRTYTLSEFIGGEGMFAQKRLDELYRINHGESDIPHRHDYFTVIFFERGEGVHIVDFTEYPIQDNSIYYIRPGQMHQVKPTAEPQGWTLKFSEEFLIANSISGKLVDDIYLFNDYGQSPPLQIDDKDMPTYVHLLEQMEYYVASPGNYVNDALGSLLKLFLIQSNNHCSLHKEENPQLVETGNRLLRSFKQHLDKHYASFHMVSDYADVLAVTADYLNKTVKNITGKPAKEHIQSKLITEAKRALLFTNLSNKELAYALGFDESAHFNNFFKKNTGLTPTEFRESIRLS